MSEVDMPKCHQCDSRALVGYDNGLRLCIRCNQIHQATMAQQELMLMAGVNRALDDMDAVAGFRLGDGRYPVAEIAAAMRRPDVNINRSNVGVVSTGGGTTVNANVNISAGVDAGALSEALSNLAQAISQSSEVDRDTKTAMLELVASLRSAPSQPRSVTLAVLKSLAEYATPLNSITALFDRAAQLVLGLQQ